MVWPIIAAKSYGCGIGKSIGGARLVGAVYFLRGNLECIATSTALLGRPSEDEVGGEDVFYSKT